MLGLAGRWFVADDPPIQENATVNETTPEADTTEQSAEPKDVDEPGDHDSNTTKQAPSEQDSLAALRLAQVTDPKTHATITTREDLCLQVDYPTGDKIIVYPDRTRVTLTTEGWKLESAGFPTIFGGDFGVSVAPAPGKIWHFVMPPATTCRPFHSKRKSMCLLQPRNPNRIVLSIIIAVQDAA